VKRLTKRNLFAGLAVALAGAVATALFWAAATTSGTRWILESLVPSGGIGFSAHTIEGRISDHLLLTGVRLDLGQQKVELDRFELRWKPSLLLAGMVAVQELTLDGVRIQDDALQEAKPLTLAWPRVPRSWQLLDVVVAKLRISGLSYRSRQEPAHVVSTLAAAVAWQDGALSFTSLNIESPSGRLQGSISSGFNQPFLTSDIAVALTQTVAGMDRITLKVQRSSSTGAEQFAGKIVLSGAAGARKLLDLSGDVGMAASGFTFRALTVSQPGRKGLVTADGSLELSAADSILSLQVKASGLDLASELHAPTDLSGTMTFAGTLDRYRGELALANRSGGWQAATLSATYQGTRAGLKMTPLKASLLDGSLTGNLDLDWHNGFALQGALNGTNLNPARIDPGWKGVANFSASAEMAWTGAEPARGSVRGALRESSLHGHTLTGEVKADFAGNNVSLARLVLQGKGFDLHAAGELNQRINLAARISDFSLLVPGASGSLQAGGWLRWRDGQLGGDVAGTGSKLAYAGTRISAADLNVRLDQGNGFPLHLTASLRDVLYDHYRLDAVSVVADGTLVRHSLNATISSAGSKASLVLAAGYSDGAWKGEVSRLAGRDGFGPWNLKTPSTFAVSAEKLFLSPLVLSAASGERLEVAADLSLKPLKGQVRSQWANLNLSRAAPWLKDMQISGSSSGTAQLGFLADKRLALVGNASAHGTFTTRGQRVSVQSSQLSFDGSDHGLRAHIELATSDGGRLKGSFSSTAPFILAMPEKGDLVAELSNLDLALLAPWLPADIRIAGRISGRAHGNMLAGQRFELDGTGSLSGGKLQQIRTDGELNLTFSSAVLSWNWRGESLSGNLALALADYGQARSSFQLPLRARFPLAFNPSGPLRASLSGKFQEKGLLTALFPGMVQESSGELDTELLVSGSWGEPLVAGTVSLAKAGAYLPTSGIHLKDVQLSARLEKNVIRVDSFRAVSGAGHLEGTALISLAGWRVVSYRGNLSGENFQTVNFPELQLISSPKLSFEGTPQKLTLRGDLLLPEMKMIGSPVRTVVTPSSDVIREGKPLPAHQASPLVMDVKVRVVLGDKVTVKVGGIDAQLNGAISLSMSSLDRVVSAGEIKVVKGRYRTYGVNLEIVRGRLFFAGGPIERPSLDFLALRTIGDVRAGVTVAGTLQKPITRLYSEPAMPDVDVVGYIVLGHPIGSSGQQASLLTQAAGALLTSSQAATFQEQLKSLLGLSTLEIQGGVGGTPGSMGYKPLQVTPPGAIPTVQQPGLTETMLTVGKYLTPNIYISYGKSLFTGNSLFRLRYDISRKWQIETQTGSESGADLYYKLEFK